MKTNSHTDPWPRAGKNNWNNWRSRISSWEANISMFLSPFIVCHQSASWSFLSGSCLCCLCWNLLYAWLSLFVFETCANKYQTKTYSTESLQAVRKVWTSSIISIYVGWTQPLYIPLPYMEDSNAIRNLIQTLWRVWVSDVRLYFNTDVARSVLLGVGLAVLAAPILALRSRTGAEYPRLDIAYRCRLPEIQLPFYFDQMWIMWQGPDVL